MIIKEIEFKDTPLSNIDLRKWCDFLRIPIKGIFSRNEPKPLFHSPCIINLDDFGNLGTHWVCCILGDPGAASRDDGIFMGESLQQERESPWALTLTERVLEAFEIPPSDWPEKYFSGQSAKRNRRATLMSSYTRLFSSSNAVVAWPVRREHF